MKKVLLFLFIIIIIVITVIYFRSPSPPSPLSPSTPTLSFRPSPYPTVHLSKRLIYNSKEYAYALISVSNPSNLSLIPNFSEKKLSTQIMVENNCVAGVNGGYYDTNGNPLGMFIADGEIIREQVKNRLIDGYFWGTEKEFSISITPTNQDVRFLLQAGPLLFYEGNPTKISITNDEYARRVVAILTNERVTFTTIYLANNVYQGPLLGDLPQILKIIEEQEQMDIVSALNLDGGNASSFISPDLRLQELSPIGSFFCIKG